MMKKIEKLEEVKRLLKADKQTEAREYACSHKISNEEFNKIWCEFYGVTIENGKCYIEGKFMVEEDKEK